MSMTYRIWRSSAARQTPQRLFNTRYAAQLRSGPLATARCPASPPAQSRGYATKPAKKSKDSQSSKREPTIKQHGRIRIPGKPPKGLEDLYGPFSPLSNGFGPRPSMSKLSPEEEKELDKIIQTSIQDLPTSIARDIEKHIGMIKKHANPDVVRKFIAEHNSSEPMTLSRAARLIRVASSISRQVAEQDVKTEQEKNQDQKQKSDQNQSQPETKMNIENFRPDWGTLITAIFTAYLAYRTIMPTENTKEITWQEFQTSLLEKGLVEKLLVINQSRVKVFVHRDAVRQMYPDSPAVNGGFFYMFTIGSVEAFETKLDNAQAQLDIPTSERIPVSYTQEISWMSTLASLLPFLLILGPTIWLSRRAGGAAGGGGSGGIFNIGRSKAKRYNHETDIPIRFKDVAGMDEAKQEIMEFVSFLKEPGQFQRLGAKIPRGAILSGPPGTGKTLLAKATAGESQVPFFSVSGSEFVEMFVGVGASRVRDLFANARKSTPCIIFIDEIDAIGKSRGKQYFGGGNDEREATLNQILTEMDGFNTSEQVVVLAGTNRPDVLDAALMRPGRFDRHISIDRPTMEGRKQIFAVHLRKILTDEDMEYLTGRLAALTPGFSGADIANACNESALIAARLKADKVRMTHFEQAIERTIGGLEKKSMVLSPEDKKTVAYHEAGHAICGWYFKYADPLLKVSIIPRGQGALGYAQYLPPGDQYLINVHQLLDRMAMTLGGRVSEELHFDTVTSGASDDFKKVTRMATAMVTKWGMSNKIGYLYFEDDQQQQLHKPFSEETARNIDLEVRRIVDEAYKQCKDLLTEKKKEVGLVAEELLSKEVLSRDDMVRLLGKRPFEDHKEFEQYFGGGAKSAPPPPPSEGGSNPPEGPLPPQSPAPVIMKGEDFRA